MSAGTGRPAAAATLYRVRFVNRDELYELYARRVIQGELYGFVTVEELVFDTATTVVVDPHEERLKREFAGVTRTMVPMHAVVRIDEVEKRGPARITSIAGGPPKLEGSVARFPPSGDGPGRRGGN